MDNNKGEKPIDGSVMKSDPIVENESDWEDIDDDDDDESEYVSIVTEATKILLRKVKSLKAQNYDLDERLKQMRLNVQNNKQAIDGDGKDTDQDVAEETEKTNKN